MPHTGATLYIVLQQLSMIDRLRKGVFQAHDAASDPDEDFAGEEQSLPAPARSREESTKDYNVNIRKQLQAIFGHLAASSRTRSSSTWASPIAWTNHQQIMHHTLVGVFSDQKRKYAKVACTATARSSRSTSSAPTYAVTATRTTRSSSASKGSCSKVAARVTARNAARESTLTNGCASRSCRRYSRGHR